jgi:hypothetical protein
MKFLNTMSEPFSINAGCETVKNGDFLTTALLFFVETGIGSSRKGYRGSKVSTDFTRTSNKHWSFHSQIPNLRDISHALN